MLTADGLEIRPASCLPSSCFCEAIRSDGIKQPANTFSSFAFVVVALAVVARRARRTSEADLLYAFALTVVGLGSAWFHATLTFNSQFADVLGMYLVATYALLYSIGRLRAGTYIATNAALAILLYWAPVVRRFVFALLLVGILIVQSFAPRRTTAKNLWIAVSIMGVAFLIWILDFTRMLCRPDSLIQGHAVWHILGAIAAWYLLLHLDEPERKRSTPW